MGWKAASYEQVRLEMKPGDVIAFSGKGNLSEIVKLATRSGVSHVGVVLQSSLLIDDDPRMGFFHHIIESASLNGFSGVTVSRLSERIDRYDGAMWWLPLKKSMHAVMDKEKFFDFLIHQERKAYDIPQVLKSAIDLLDDIPFLNKATYNDEDFSRFFCSELVAAGLEAAGCITHINASEVTPIDLCSFSIYENDYYQIKGIRREIQDFNTIDPTGWGEPPMEKRGAG